MALILQSHFIKNQATKRHPNNLPIEDYYLRDIAYQHNATPLLLLSGRRRPVVREQRGLGRYLSDWEISEGHQICHPTFVRTDTRAKKFGEAQLLVSDLQHDLVGAELSLDLDNKLRHGSLLPDTGLLEDGHKLIDLFITLSLAKNAFQLAVEVIRCVCR